MALVASTPTVTYVDWHQFAGNKTTTTQYYYNAHFDGVSMICIWLFRRSILFLLSTAAHVTWLVIHSVDADHSLRRTCALQIHAAQMLNAFQDTITQVWKYIFCTIFVFSREQNLSFFYVFDIDPPTGKERPVCTCIPGYTGNPLSRCNRGECQSDNECSENRACINYACVDPCIGQVSFRTKLFAEYTFQVIFLMINVLCMISVWKRCYLWGSPPFGRLQMSARLYRRCVSIMPTISQLSSR